MKTYLKKTTDPQTPVSVRFGSEDDGTIEWGERQDIRILISDGSGRGEKDDWYLTPMTLDGRPLNMTFVGEGTENGGCVLREQNTNHVLQILKIVEPSILRQGVDDGDLPAKLASMSMEREDLSPLGRVLYDAVTEFEGQIPDEFIDQMLEELPNFHGT